MLVLLRFCWRAYDIALRFYPQALRESFGPDISEAFRLQTLDAWHEGGWLMLLRVLGCATRELFTEALPARANSPMVIAGIGSFACNCAAFWCLLWAFQNPLAVKALGNHLQRIIGLG
jgi:hypothetical protein